MFFIDLEASSLEQGSYPIEIGWVNLEGNGESYLIRPTKQWLEQGTWSKESEGVHGISMEELMQKGVSVEEVAEHLNKIRNHLVFSDSPSFDQYWLNCILKQAGVSSIPLKPVEEAYGMIISPLRTVIPARELSHQAMRIVAQAEHKVMGTKRVLHRAFADAQNLRDIASSIAYEVESISHSKNSQLKSNI